ncbi:Retrovirus-related Pol polyprotein from transposon 17.6 [Gossypium australe]|uniref:Retrovirus-related Pol polyprotein from transposon 17.6 n=1 Tax=Gossypium australe TaxID=47621 RepID=A0A5B6X3A5_9ROSI|nr:Retrovirus-related Pol polyprotein from transposon 17.6 [Gossypium australe]
MAGVDLQVVEAVRQEVVKLLSAGFIREIEYLDWVSNVFVVKKENGKYRMCIDFTNLNKVTVQRAHNMKLNLEKYASMCKLTGRMVTPNRFISRMADKCLSFFKALRTSFSWTEECQAAFEELKLYLTSPLLLKPPRVVKPSTLRKLRLYFQAHPIVVGTNQPMNEVLSKENTLGWVTKWGIQLAKFGIEFSSRTAIKGQVLVDSMVECSFEKVIDTTRFDKVQIKQLPRSDNTRADGEQDNQDKKELTRLQLKAESKGGKKGLKKVGEAKGTWLEELAGILWVLRATPHTAMGETTFSPVYGVEVVIPAEIGMREVAEVRNTTCAQQVARYYNTKVKNK